MYGLTLPSCHAEKIKCSIIKVQLSGTRFGNFVEVGGNCYFLNHVVFLSHAAFTKQMFLLCLFTVLSGIRQDEILPSLPPEKAAEEARMRSAQSISVFTITTLLNPL